MDFDHLLLCYALVNIVIRFFNFSVTEVTGGTGTRAEVGVCWGGGGGGGVYPPPPPLFFKKWSCLSKSLPFSLIEVHYQYCKGCNLSISLNKVVNWSNSGLTKRDRDENVDCGGME